MDKRVVGLALLWSAWAVTYGVGFRGQWRWCQLAREALGPLGQQAEAYGELIGRFPNPTKEIKILDDRLAELEKQRLSAEVIPRVIQQLASFAGQTGVTLASVEPQPEQETSSAGLPKGVGKRFVEVRVNCTTETLGEFFLLLEKLPNPVSVEGLKIRKSRQDPSGLFQADLLLAIYGLV